MTADRQHHTTRDQAAAHLRALREQWGDLLAAIQTRPADVWPPVRSITRELARTDEPEPPAAVGRLPLVLREYPAPLNTDALDCAVSIEREVFDLADRIATTIQRPVRREHVPMLRDPYYVYVDAADRDHPARWHLPTHRDAGPADIASAGSRTYGLHWACVWVEGRVLDEPEDDLFAPLPVRLLDDAHAVASRSLARLERTLNRDTRTTPLPAPCPWCGSGLIGRNTGGDPQAAIVWCTGGRACGAPVELDAFGRRHWARGTLPQLYGALEQRRSPKVAER